LRWIACYRLVNIHSDNRLRVIHPALFDFLMLLYFADTIAAYGVILVLNISQHTTEMSMQHVV